MSTYVPRAEDIQRKWYLIDAKEAILGRLASTIANIIRGKNKVIFTPHLDTGDYVVVINADKVKLTGSKETDKIYHHYSGFPGGYKSASVRELRAKHPERIILKAVKGMIPKNKLGDAVLKKLKIYAGEKHPHEGQMPEKIEIKG